MTGTSRPPWLGIELRHLTALSAVAEEGSFRGAADRLGYVQSAVSQQIAHLEELVGARLVDRRRGVSPVAPTEAGRVLLHHFGAILSRFSAAQADMEALQSGRAGQLRVGAYEPVASRLMPRILVAFAARMPAIEAQLEEWSPSELEAGVASGRLDLAFGELPLPPGPFDAREIARDPYVLLVPADWPIARGDALPTPSELGSMPLVAPPRCSFDRVDAELRTAGVEPRYRFRPATYAAVQALVAAGMGAAVVPRLSVDGRDDRTVPIELGELLPPRVLTLYWHRERRPSPALEAFLEVAAQASRRPARAHPVGVQAA